MTNIREFQAFTETGKMIWGWAFCFTQNLTCTAKEVSKFHRIISKSEQDILESTRENI